ncbi:MAG: TldD/PmbA family protein [Halanaerobiales bacterium]|nr:TldD/PmbA family protein [Halanaerobiales bacterium]
MLSKSKIFSIGKNYAKNAPSFDVYNENKLTLEHTFDNNLNENFLTTIDKGYSVQIRKNENESCFYSFPEVSDFSSKNYKWQLKKLNQTYDITIKDFLRELKSLNFVQQVSYTKLNSINTVQILNKHLSIIEDVRKFTNVKIDLLLEENMFFKHYSFNVPQDLSSLLKEIKEIVKTFPKTRSIDDLINKPFQVVLDQGIAGILFHEAVGHLVEADYMKFGSSLKNYLGKEIANNTVNLVDYGGKENDYYLSKYDDEGNPHKKISIIKNGFLSNLLFSEKFNPAYSCNARRQSFRFETLPRMSNTYLELGNSNLEDIIKSTEFGVLIKNYFQGETNPYSGEFSFIASDVYLLENGKITCPLNSIKVSADTHVFLKSIMLIGNDLKFYPGFCGKMGQFIPVTMGSPTIKVDNLRVRGV